MKAKATRDASDWILRLYVAGQSPRSTAALRSLRTICERHLAGRYRLEVIDLLKQPELARRDDIVALPTLVRRLPPPLKKIIGDLSSEERVLVGLELRPRSRRIRGPHDAALAPHRSRSPPPAAAEPVRPAPVRHRHHREVDPGHPQHPPHLRPTPRRPYTLEVIDLYKNLQLARRDQIVAAPTLIKRTPLPFRRLLGDMSVEDRVLAVLDLHPDPVSGTPE